MPPGSEEFSGYVVEQTVGRGGSSTVYRARRAGEAAVALKVLHPNHRDARGMSRLAHEVDIASRLDHSQIVTVSECGPYWFAMQYVDGGNATTLPVQSRLAALAQIADALDYAHRMGIVHCDVKPTNILVHEDFSQRGAVLIDFGVAHSLAEDMAFRLSRDHSRLSLDPARRITRQRDQAVNVQASLPYAAPEILLGRMPSAACDQYSLACTTVDLLTGMPPFVAKTPAALMDAHVNKSPPRLSRRIPQLPHSFDSILAKAMAKDPDLRYESCTEFIGLVESTMRRGTR